MDAFEYDSNKDKTNQEKHGVSFALAARAFHDPQRIVMQDEAHSEKEKRYFCFGKVDGYIVTVRFTLRGKKVRIFGAAYWRKGKKIYEQENSL